MAVGRVLLAVGEFRKLALLAEADGHLRQKLQQVLKLSKEKWDDARDHAMRAVVADNRMRIWCGHRLCYVPSVSEGRPLVGYDHHAACGVGGMRG